MKQRAPERRSEPRLLVRWRGVASYGDQQIHVRINDVSRSGMGFLAPVGVPVGATLDIVVSALLGEERVALRARLEVKHNVFRPSEEAYLIGTSIVELGSADRERLEAHINARKLFA